MPEVTIIKPTQKQVSHKQIRKVAVYARVSTKMEEQLSSYKAQISYFTDYVQSNPEWELVGVYADYGITGRKTECRPRFNEMIEAALNGCFDLIVTKSISRFARNTVDCISTIRTLRSAGVEVLFEKENIRTFDAKSEVLLTILASLAQEESRSISENAKWGIRKRFADGIYHIPYKSVLGYCKGDDGKLCIVESEAEIVRLIYRMYLEGCSRSSIRKYLNDNGVPSPTGKPIWGQQIIYNILTNEKYVGDALMQKEYVESPITGKKKHNNGELRQYYVRDAHPAIIDRETWDRVQEEIKRRSLKSKK